MDSVSQIKKNQFEIDRASLTEQIDCYNWLPDDVQARRAEVALDAWSDTEQLPNAIAKCGVAFLRDGMPVDEVRFVYRDVGRKYLAMLHAIDFSQLVEHRWSVTGRDPEREKKRFKKSFVRVEEDEYEQSFIVYLDKLPSEGWAAENALLCALIGQDWGTAEELAKCVPFKLSTKAKAEMTLSLLRYTILDQKREVSQRCTVYSAKGSGVDFSPRASEFAQAIVNGDEAALGKALTSVNQAFRRKWDLKKYLTERWIQYHGSEEALLRVVVRDLHRYSWSYSVWATALLSLAAHRGLRLFTKPKKFSEWAPIELCITAED
jgi:hypothetical protein